MPVRLRAATDPCCARFFSVATCCNSNGTGRIRLQSGKFEAMWVILHDLTERLKVGPCAWGCARCHLWACVPAVVACAWQLYFRSTSESHEDTFTISYTEPIPFPVRTKLSPTAAAHPLFPTLVHRATACSPPS